MKQINNIEPTAILENIFRIEELSSMLKMLEEHDSLIDKYLGVHNPVKYPPKTGGYFGMFGKPWYFDYNYTSYSQYLSMGAKTKDILHSTVPYPKLLQAISDSTGKAVLLSDKLNPPGFHIFANYTDTTISDSVNNWHEDRFEDNILGAWLVAIELPEEPCGVEYSKGMFTYTTNTLYGWYGDMRHSISKMTLKPNERRITLQAFTLEKEDKLYLFW